MTDEQVQRVATIVVESWARDFAPHECIALADRAGWALDHRQPSLAVVRAEDGEPLTEDDLIHARAADRFIDDIAAGVERDLAIEKFEQGLGDDDGGG